MCICMGRLERVSENTREKRERNGTILSICTCVLLQIIKVPLKYPTTSVVELMNLLKAMKLFIN